MNEANLQTILEHAGVEKVEFLGEGAWHQAWHVTKENRKLVLRIPKQTAYGEKVQFDNAQLQAEYASTKLYYQSVNQAVPGAAPGFFDYVVSPETTYTLEAFGGHAIDLHVLTEQDAFHIGKSVGDIYRKTEQVPHNIEGFGYLSWSEHQGLKGSLTGDFHQFIAEETEEHLSDYRNLVNENPAFYDEIIEEALKLAGELRKERFTKPCLSNQDASPENILINDSGVCLIDPFPNVYYARGMAGNFMNLYQTFFIALSETERYKHHRFEACTDQLRKISQRFLEGYSAGDSQIEAEVRGEQLLQLLETVHSHVQLLKEGLSKEQVIRYGNKAQIESRMYLLADELKRLAASEIETLIRAVRC